MKYLFNHYQSTSKWNPLKLEFFPLVFHYKLKLPPPSLFYAYHIHFDRMSQMFLHGQNCLFQDHQFLVPSMMTPATLRLPESLQNW